MHDCDDFFRPFEAGDRVCPGPCPRVWGGEMWTGTVDKVEVRPEHGWVIVYYTRFYYGETVHDSTHAYWLVRPAVGDATGDCLDHAPDCDTPAYWPNNGQDCGG